MSAALDNWKNVRSSELDEVEQSHHAVEGKARGRRFATLQVNHAYATLVSSQFQGYCRDLHSEAAAFLRRSCANPNIGLILSRALTTGRKLDFGNPNPGNIGSDFAALGVVGFWDLAKQESTQTQGRQRRLEQLNDWRNAIAHQDWTKVGTSRLRLSQVRNWRSACSGLATTFDRVVFAHLVNVVGHPPW